MTEIPDDVKKAAVVAFNTAIDMDRYEGSYEVIARAILAERERCAKVAISHAPATQDFADAPLQDMAKRIAAAIRK